MLHGINRLYLPNALTLTCLSNASAFSVIALVALDNGSFYQAWEGKSLRLGCCLCSPCSSSLQSDTSKNQHSHTDLDFVSAQQYTDGLNEPHHERSSNIEAPIVAGDARGPTDVTLHHEDDRPRTHGSSVNNFVMPMIDVVRDRVDDGESALDETTVSFPVEHLTVGPRQRAHGCGSAEARSINTLEDLAGWFQREYMTGNACVTLEQDEWSNQLNSVRDNEMTGQLSLSSGKRPSPNEAAL